MMARGQKSRRGVDRAQRQRPKPPAHPVLTGFTQAQTDKLLKQADAIRQILSDMPASTREQGEAVVSAAAMMDKVKNAYRKVAKVD